MDGGPAELSASALIPLYPLSFPLTNHLIPLDNGVHLVLYPFLSIIPDTPMCFD